MNTHMIAPIEHAVQTAKSWITELAQDMGWDERRAYRAFAAVLHALRDRLTVAETADLGAQLPLLVRGLYYEGWDPQGKPVKERRKEEFLDHIAAALRDDPEIFPEGVAWSVFKLLNRRISAGEIGDVKHILPAQIRSLWPEEKVAHVS
jgi:uncharacterized protein (DUF2267 family)